MKQDLAPQSAPFKLEKVVRKVLLHEIDEELEDLEYWLSKSPQERVAAVTFIVSQSLIPGQRIDKTMVKKRQLRLESTK